MRQIKYKEPGKPVTTNGKAVITEYDVQGENLSGSDDLHNAILSCAAVAGDVNYKGTNFSRLGFAEGATLKITNANLTGTIWDGVDTGRIVFEDVSLTDSNITLEQLAKAEIDLASTLPAGITHDMILAQQRELTKKQKDHASAPCLNKIRHEP